MYVGVPQNLTQTIRCMPKIGLTFGNTRRVWGNLQEPMGLSHTLNIIVLYSIVVMSSFFCFPDDGAKEQLVVDDCNISDTNYS